MKGFSIIRLLAVTIAALFLLAQGLSYAHAAEHGADHDHDGVACAVVVLGEDGADLPLPAITQTAPVAQNPQLRLEPTRTVGFDTTPPCRAPPPRAPPTPLHA